MQGSEEEEVQVEEKRMGTLEVCSLLTVVSIRAEFEMLTKSQSSNLILQPIKFHSLTDSYLLVWVRAARTGGAMRTLEEQPSLAGLLPRVQTGATNEKRISRLFRGTHGLFRINKSKTAK